MNAKYTPIKIGRSGDKTHIGIVMGERINRFGRTELAIRQICGIVNTKHINRPVAITQMRENTPITCDRCREKLARLQERNEATNLVAAA